MLTRLLVFAVSLYLVYKLYVHTAYLHDTRFPNYGLTNNPYRFIDENNVGEGSCIYNPIDPGADGVLFDWAIHNQKYGQSLYRDPPLDPVEYEEAYNCCPT